MSTRSNVAVVDPTNNTVKVVYIHGDGYPDGVGNCLLKYYETFEKANNVVIPFKYGERRKGDVEKIYADNSKATRVLKWKAEKSFETAMEDVWRWQQKLNNFNF